MNNVIKLAVDVLKNQIILSTATTTKKVLNSLVISVCCYIIVIEWTNEWMNERKNECCNKFCVFIKKYRKSEIYY